MVCHGELARRRPHPRYLTQFYLMVSLGGAIGGLFVALAAPRLFNSYAELPVGMALCAILVACVLWIDMPRIWLRASVALLAIGFRRLPGLAAERRIPRLHAFGPEFLWGPARPRRSGMEGHPGAAPADSRHHQSRHPVEGPRRRPHPDLLFRHRLRHQSGTARSGRARSHPHRRCRPGRGRHRDPRPRAAIRCTITKSIRLVADLAKSDSDSGMPARPRKRLYLGDGRLVLEKHARRASRSAGGRRVFERRRAGASAHAEA